ncbi:hypothetical protein NDU88_006336 [Pleurodeles waltl]|uniref:Uncharacterized protein n=1 Tax=Pleurodeles waltl TaxID=8319 RepID=A0AAV7PI53_PLEWA|nr:hypothetical protein NDU88_006336 [Pleurodeles waltl]
MGKTTAFTIKDVKDIRTLLALEHTKDTTSMPLINEILADLDIDPFVSTESGLKSASKCTPPLPPDNVIDKEESQQSEMKLHVIINDSLLLELDTVAASTTDPTLLFPATVFPVYSSMVSEEHIFDLPVSDLDVKPATPMPPAMSLKLKTPENQHSETEVLKKVMTPTKIKDMNLNLVFGNLMISTVLSVLLQETIIHLKGRAEKLDNNAKAISEETPVPFLSKNNPSVLTELKINYL